MRSHLPVSLAVAGLLCGCAGTTVTTTVLPPHRLEDPICPSAVIVNDDPTNVPPGGRLLARLRVEGGGMRVTNEKIRRRLQEAAARLGANRVLAVEVTTPGTLEALGMTLAQGYEGRERERIRNDAMTNQQQTTQATAPVPTDPGFYGRGLAYAIFVPIDTIRTNMECHR